MPIYMDIIGAQQGKIEGVMQGHSWLVTSIAGGFDTPYDLSSGIATGRRVHKPLIISMDYGENVVSLIRAAATNELLNVVLHNYENGQEIFRIILGGATIVDFSISSGGDRPSESLSFTYQKIEWLAHGKAAQDDWLASGTA